MTEKITRGSGDVFKDLGLDKPDVVLIQEALDSCSWEGGICGISAWFDEDKVKQALAALDRLAAFFSLETGFDVTDPKLNAARYDGYLDGVSVGLAAAKP